MGKIYVVAGEISGDLHGAELLESLQKCGVDAFAGWGGPKMAEIAGTKDWVEKAGVMGIWEVLKQYSWFKKRFEETVAEIEEWQPDVLILIDYPGFNLRLAKVVRERFPQVKILQYVCPQVWAWKRGRIPKMAKWLDQVVCLFPFEVEVLAKGGCPGVYHGHPLVEELRAKVEDVSRDSGLIGLFPGSRYREVDRLFPVMLEAARMLRQTRPELRFEVPAVSEKLALHMREMASGEEGIIITVGSSQSLMQRAECAVMASGTATLEAAWFGLPYCLVYKMAPLTWRVAQAVVKVDYAGIVNILAGEEIVKELLQDECSPKTVTQWVEGALSDSTATSALSEKLLAIAAKLGEGGVHERVAGEVMKLLEEEKTKR